MFDTSAPRLFGLPPGVDFPQALVQGLRDRLPGPPEAMARVELYVNTTRMARRLREIFDQGPPCLLPQIRLVTDLADPLSRAVLPRPVPSLRRRLELTGLVSKLLDAQPELAPRSALFDLADSLASLMEEMQGEDVPPSKVAQLDVTDQSGHWQRALTFFNIVQQYFEDDSAPDAQAYTRMALTRRLDQWRAHPPQHPVIIAGSTGSRGTTAAFMQAVAHLPQGAVVLPGFDPHMPQDVWDQLQDPLTGEDHPQFRFARLLQMMDVTAGDIQEWATTAPPSTQRNRLISLALRPAPVTHQWLSEGPDLGVLTQATDDLTLVEAASPRQEALAIALRLRHAAEDGTTAALITPDRMLTRQVTSALDRWGILPDDSAGTPAQLSPPGRLMRHVAALFQSPLTAETLLALLKHPLTHAGAERGAHLLNTRDLELFIRRNGMPYPTPDPLIQWATSNDRVDWITWLITTLCDQTQSGTRPISDWITRHVALAETLSKGAFSDDASALWDKNAGIALRKIVEDLTAEAPHGADMTARDYGDLFHALLSRAEIRDRDAPHPQIKIWGTLEARVMGADLLILAGLNEGSWPEMPSADPWLNRKMRADAGLLLPDRNIGLSAHDFQQAVAAKDVWLTRSLKSDNAETVPSRWVNRLTNLMTGLPDQAGPKALDQMRKRGVRWLQLADAVETPTAIAPATRPSPAPPVVARPLALSVTEIKRLVRDPFAIFARHVLRLRPLDPLMRAPDALMRGILLHKVIETFVTDTLDDPDTLIPDHLRKVTSDILHAPNAVPFPTIRALWQARMNLIAPQFCAAEHQRQKVAQADKRRFEISGHAMVPQFGFTLKAVADRIDIDTGGLAHIYDYKTGAAPSKSEQKYFDKQLLLEAAMVTNGAFKGLAPMHVARATFVSLKPSDPKEVDAPLDETPTDVVWTEFCNLITAYMSAETGYTARRALMRDADISDYDQLARFGEWDVTDLPVKVDLI